MAGRRLDADEGPGGTHLGDRPGAERRRNAGEIGDLVLPAHHPAEVDTPYLRPAAGIPQRLERDRHLHRPAVGGALRPRIPDRRPVAVHIPLVHDQPVEEAAHRVHVEEEGVPAVVEGVEDDREVLVVEDAEVVAPHLRRHHPLRLAVVTAAGDVHGVVVVEDPDLGRFRRRFPFERERLDESAHAGNAVVDGIVEAAVELEGAFEPDGAHGGAAGLVAPHGLRVIRGRRAPDDEGRGFLARFVRGRLRRVVPRPGLCGGLLVHRAGGRLLRGGVTSGEQPRRHEDRGEEQRRAGPWQGPGRRAAGRRFRRRAHEGTGNGRAAGRRERTNGGGARTQRNGAPKGAEGRQVRTGTAG